MRCVVTEYRDFPTVEWTLSFRNTARRTRRSWRTFRPWTRAIGAEATGTNSCCTTTWAARARANDYAPLETALGPGASKRIGAAGGRPTNSDMSYFNLEWAGGGVIVAVGWPGQWAAEFVRETAGGLRISCGPGTDALQAASRRRSPHAAGRAAVLAGRGLDPRPERLAAVDGRAQPARGPAANWSPRTTAAASATCCPGQTRKSQQIDGLFAGRDQARLLVHRCRLVSVRRIVGEHRHLGGRTAQRFPRGLREVADHVHAAASSSSCGSSRSGSRPARGWRRIIPEWVLGGKSGGLLNLGNPEAWQWARRTLR